MAHPGEPHPKGIGGHNLVILYDGVSAIVRRELEARFDATPKLDAKRRRAFRVHAVPPEQGTPPPSTDHLSRAETLPAILFRAQDAFVTWRYLHEHSRSDMHETWDFEYWGLGVAWYVLATVASERLRAMLGTEDFTLN